MMQKRLNKKAKLSWYERRELAMRERAQRLQRLTFEQRMILERW